MPCVCPSFCRCGDDFDVSPVQVSARMSHEMRGALDTLRDEIALVDERNDSAESLANACRTFADLELVYRHPGLFVEVPPATEVSEDQAFYLQCASRRRDGR